MSCARFAVPAHMSEAEWLDIERTARRNVEEAVAGALALPTPTPDSLQRHVFCEPEAGGARALQRQGGIAPEGMSFPPHRQPRRPSLRASTC